jgi:ribonuclease P/MRP protein subunit POP5
MVRVKHRYLLIDILYPAPSSDTLSATATAAGPGTGKNTDPEIQARLRIHAPTSDALSPGLLAKMVREEVSEMFGDWGVGRLGGAGAGGVSGMCFLLLFCSCFIFSFFFGSVVQLLRLLP